MAVTQKDIALRVGLSRSLVGAVLENRSGVWASADTRRRVLQAAQEMNYRPHIAAKRLRSGKTHNIALVWRFDPVRHGPWEPVIGTMSMSLATAGYELILRAHSDQKSALHTLKDLVQTSACDGFIVWDIDEEAEEQASLLESLNVPFVVKGRFENSHPHWHQVDFDHERMTGQLVERFVALGHRRIFFIGFDNEQFYTRSLRSGYCAGMARAFGANPPDTWIAKVLDRVDDFEEVMNGWLALQDSESPTAVVMGSANSTWYGIEKALARYGRVIGEGNGEFAVSGIAHGGMPLIYGSGVAYQDAETTLLAKHIAKTATFLLDGNERDIPTVQRIIPELTPLAQLNMRRPDIGKN